MHAPDMIRIAYVDDSVAVRKGIIAFLTSLGGIQVDIEADNGQQLIDKLKTRETPDICLLDISMPVLDGFDTLTQITTQWPQMKVLVLTIHKLDYYIIRMIRHGASGYLLKSCDPEEIKKALIAVYNTGFYYSNTITSRFVQQVRSKEISIPNFTEAEIEMLKHCCSDLTYIEIAEKMNTTVRSIEGYRDSLFNKLSVNSRVSLSMFAIQFGLVPLEMKIPTTNSFLNNRPKK